MPGITFLIDFENTHDSGLNGIRSLNEDDLVYLFYTDNANKLSLDYLTDINVPITVKKVIKGSQSLDMHLVSFLGYLIGNEPDKNRQYVIVSNDTDFDGVISFWCNQFNDDHKIVRYPSIHWSTHTYADEPESHVDVEQISPDLKQSFSKLLSDTIRLNGHMEINGYYSMLLSQLCSKLENNPLYISCRKTTGCKPQSMLVKFFASAVTVVTKESSIWVYDTPDICLMDKQKLTAYDAEEILLEAKYKADTAKPIPYEEPILDIKPVSDISYNLIKSKMRDESVSDISAKKKRIITECLLANGLEKSTTFDIADWMTLLISDRTGKRAIYQSMLTHYGRKHGLELYTTLREAFKQIDIPGGNCFEEA